MKKTILKIVTVAALAVLTALSLASCDMLPEPCADFDKLRDSNLTLSIKILSPLRSKEINKKEQPFRLFFFCSF